MNTINYPLEEKYIGKVTLWHTPDAIFERARGGTLHLLKHNEDPRNNNFGIIEIRYKQEWDGKTLRISSCSMEDILKALERQESNTILLCPSVTLMLDKWKDAYQIYRTYQVYQRSMPDSMYRGILCGVLLGDLSILLDTIWEEIQTIDPWGDDNE